MNREQEALDEMNRTRISPPVAVGVCAVFAVTLVLVPVVQAIVDVPSTGRLRVVELARTLPAVSTVFSATKGGVVEKTFAANTRLVQGLRDYERVLEEGGWLSETCHPPVQFVLTCLLKSGNEQVYVGRNGWLYFAPDVASLSNPRPPGADPAAAIVDFHRQLARRNTRLVLLPVPVKPSIEPGPLARSGSPSPLADPAWNSIRELLDREGVLVSDAALALASERTTSPSPLYLATDTHWTPAAMERTARRLAVFLTAQQLIEPAAFQAQRAPRRVSHFGDTASLLRLPPNQLIFAPDVVDIHPVRGPRGRQWSPNESAEVLLLGDSFTNIFSQAGLGWGESAGLAEQLSRELGRPIDRIAINDNGASATRQELARDLAGGRNRLSGKRVVIWQFSMRELAQAGWPLIAMELRSESKPGETVVTATVKDAATMPAPGTTPYTDCLRGLHLVQVQAVNGSAAPQEIVAYVWGMQNNRWTESARLQPGEKLKLRLIPWSGQERLLGRVARAELDDPDLILIDLPTYWAEPVK